MPVPPLGYKLNLVLKLNHNLQWLLYLDFDVIGKHHFWILYFKCFAFRYFNIGAVFRIPLKS
jgi:hypothetical protein